MAFLASLLNGFFGFILAGFWFGTNFLGKRCWTWRSIFLCIADLRGRTNACDRQGWIGRVAAQCGVQILFGRLGILVAMIFVSFLRGSGVQPVLREVDVELEEAAWCLGASPLDTFRRVLFPSLLPSILVG
jgi:sulfate transport system permease protein